MKRKIFPYAAVLFLTASLLSGCTGSQSLKTEQKAADPMVYETDSAEAVAEGSAQGFTEEASTEQAMEDSAEAKQDAGSSKKISGEDRTARKLIKTVSLWLETTVFDKLKKQVEETVASYGGYIENSDYSAPQNSGQLRSYSLTARIPADKLDAFVEETGWEGTVTNKSENVEDVTLDYVDKTAYKESLEKEYEKVMELLEQAKDLDQILLLESKLSDLRYEINSYESQLRIYDNQIDYASIHIYISEVEYENGSAETVGGRISSGFRGSLYTVKNFFVNLFVEVISDLPILLLWACTVAVLIVVIRKLRKKFVKKAKKGQQEEDRGNSD